LSIDARGRLYLNVGASPKQSIDDQTALIRATVALRRTPGRPVLVNGDQAVSYGRVVQAMVLLQQAGARSVGFETQTPPKPAAASAP
jgi:biopolymer transport protein TolR